MPIAVVYNNCKYRIHAADCRDVKRERGFIDGLREFPDGSTLAQIAAVEFSDFIAEDPEYYNPETVLAEFTHGATVLPCATDRIGRTDCRGHQLDGGTFYVGACAECSPSTETGK